MAPVLSPEAPLWNVEQAAAFLRSTPRTIYAWVEAGRIPCIRIGGKFLRFDPAEIARWLDEFRQGGDAA